MKKRRKIIIVILAVLIVGGGGGWWAAVNLGESSERPGFHRHIDRLCYGQ